MVLHQEKFRGSNYPRNVNMGEGGVSEKILIEPSLPIPILLWKAYKDGAHPFVHLQIQKCFDVQDFFIKRPTKENQL